MFQVKILSIGGFDSIMIFVILVHTLFKAPRFPCSCIPPQVQQTMLASLAYLACVDHTLPQRN